MVTEKMILHYEATAFKIFQVRLLPLSTVSLLCMALLGFQPSLLADPLQDRPGQLQQIDLTSERNALREMIIEGRAQAALDQIESLRKIHTSDAGLIFLQGEALYALERLEEAVSAFQDGLKLDPSKKGKLFNYGRALQTLGKDEEALLVFNRMQTRPEVSFQIRGLFGAGLSKQNLGNDQTAITLYRQSLKLDPSFDRARYRLAILLMRNQPSQALSMLDAILSRDPLHHGSAYNRALALRNLKRSDEARVAMDHYRKILAGRSRIALLRERWALDTQNLEIILELGRVHRELRAFSEALRWYSRGGLAAPGDPRPGTESVRTLLLAGKRAEAGELVNRLQGTAAAKPAQALLKDQTPDEP